MMRLYFEYKQCLGEEQLSLFDYFFYSEVWDFNKNKMTL